MGLPERIHLDRVKRLGCILCRLEALRLSIRFEPYPASTAIHHLRYGQGKAQRASDFLTVGLCEQHHTGQHGVHGDRLSLKQFDMDELDLLAAVIQLIQEVY